ncbi:carboxypeptidase-like regulatory domain-containing protein [Polaribacter tangerinus]|uniref:carboxypeptidase-like regulatory domain-containing protein n=1 Tax=Polaribacter tangerinus TaxID=1920034 RepID=UPI000B4AE3A1|nr:carboxypeptidase-like regulatory domain-containing protein [Polaribacter tangerinus]
MKKILCCLVLLSFGQLSSQNFEKKDIKTIVGVVLYNNNPLPNVLVSNTEKTVLTNNKGFYNITAKSGDFLEYKHAGFRTVSILIEDITATLNIDMEPSFKVPNVNRPEILKLGRSTVGDEYPDFDIITIDKDKLNKEAITLTNAILEKVPLFFSRINNFNEPVIYLKGKELNGPVLWEIDGNIYDLPLPIDLNDIEKILIVNMKSDRCIIKVSTNLNYKKIKGFDVNNYYFTNDEYYNDDATPYEEIKKDTPSYLNAYKNALTINEAITIYKKQYDECKDFTNFHFNVYNFLVKKFNAPIKLLNVLNDFENFSKSNVENLKALAYMYDELNLPTKASEIYKKIANESPNSRQAYRDLANTYLSLKDYKNFWKIYNYYIEKGFEIDQSDIGEIIASEIISAFNKDENNDSTPRKIKIKNPIKNTESDVRLVFEWNTSEAEFSIEFVNTFDQVYTLENSLKINEALIIDQKNRGYNSKEVFIENLDTAPILVNFTYFGNKQYKPTFLKVTRYLNWGKPNEIKKIHVFEFNTKNIKTQLFKLNKKMLD